MSSVSRNPPAHTEPSPAVPSHWHEPKVRRAVLGLIFVVFVFVVAPVVAMVAVSQ
jgi:hypothetical protein